MTYCKCKKELHSSGPSAKKIRAGVPDRLSRGTQSDSIIPGDRPIPWTRYWDMRSQTFGGYTQVDLEAGIDLGRSSSILDVTVT